MSIIAVVNPENVSEIEANKFKIRSATRGVVFDDDKNIALLKVEASNYHKLPGGGVEDGEDLVSCLKRECKEETGCDIYVGESLGSVVEYRKQFGQKQISYCFIAKVMGDKGKVSFTADEIGAGFELVWYQLEEAMMILETEVASDYVGKYIVTRDYHILAQAKKVLV